MQKSQIQSQKSQIQFSKILLGNCTFTLVSKKTGNRFTYKCLLSQRSVLSRKLPGLYFIYLMTGSDNESSFSYIGTYSQEKGLNNQEKGFNWSLKSRVNPDLQSIKAIKYLFTNPQTDFIEIYHEGRCCKCGKKLTTPESILSGVGPKCGKA